MSSVRVRRASAAVEADLALDEFVTIMGALPAGVAVVTTLDADGTPRGLTTTAVCSVSKDPPMVLVSVDRRSRTLPALERHGRFVINFMRAGRDATCAHFASKTEDKFADVSWHPNERGLPVLHEDAHAWLECVTEQRVEAGDHIILIGRAGFGQPPQSSDRPLVYLRRTYGEWGPGASA